MSITDELREWTRTHTVNCSDNRIALVAIADRIDAEHEKAAAGCIHYDPERHYCSVHGDTESGWVRLPLDADGVPIHVGDVMEVINSKQRAKACYLQIGPSGGWAVGLTKECHWYDIESLRHHHPPTVEDVLLEACKAYHGLMVESMSDVAHDMPAPSEVIAEYAAKLRLAGEDE